MQSRPTLYFEGQNQERALRKGWGTLTLVEPRNTKDKKAEWGPPVLIQLEYPDRYGRPYHGPRRG